MDIQTKDGILLRNIPDGTTDDVIKARIQQIRLGNDKPEPSTFDNIAQGAGNLAGGFVRGAGSIGSSILSASEMMPGAIIGNLVMGRDINPMARDKERRQGMDDGLTQMGAEPDSTLFKTGKIGGEVAGTAGAGGLLGNAVKGLAPALGESIASGGFSLGSTAGKNMLLNGLTRIGGGAINGGISAGMVDPESAGFGAAIGGAIPAVVKPVGAVAGSIGDALKPFTEGGKQKILASYLQNLVGNELPQVVNNLKNAKGYTAGFNPTTGQASNSANLATLERTMKARVPSLFNNVDQSQRTALADSIRGIGGDDLTRKGLLDARDTAVEGLYDTAKQANIPIDAELGGLLNRPAVKQAINEAKQNAMNRGGNLPIKLPEPTGVIGANGLPVMTNPTLSGNSAHEIKMALDAAKNHTAVGGANKAQLSAIGDASNSFNQFLENAIPEYGQAKSTFAQMSKPINQMDLGNAIADKFIPASLRDMPNPLQLNRENLAKILYDNGDNLAKSVTGFKGSTLENTLRPDQLNAIKNAVKDGQFIKQGELLGKGGGSDTFQKLAFNGDMEKAGVIGKLLNIPMIGATANAVKGVAGMAYNGANKQLEEKLALALLNPQEAKTLLTLSPDSRAKVIANLIKNRGLGTVGAVSSAQ